MVLSFEISTSGCPGQSTEGKKPVTLLCSNTGNSYMGKNEFSAGCEHHSRVESVYKVARHK